MSYQNNERKNRAEILEIWKIPLIRLFYAIVKFVAKYVMAKTESVKRSF